MRGLTLRAGVAGLAALMLVGGSAIAMAQQTPAAPPAAANVAGAVTYSATLSGASEVPANTTAGTGTATFTFDPATKTLTWHLEYSGLTGAATGAHIHGPADTTASADVIIPFGDDLASPIEGSAVLTDEQVGWLQGGQLYVNVHTDANPAGEIRGQIVTGAGDAAPAGTPAEPAGGAMAPTPAPQ